MIVKLLFCLSAVRQENERMMYDVLQAGVLNRTQSSGASRWRRATRRARGSTTSGRPPRRRRSRRTPGPRPTLGPRTTSPRYPSRGTHKWPPWWATRWATPRPETREPHPPSAVNSLTLKPVTAEYDAVTLCTERYITKLFVNWEWRWCVGR